jgi:sugar phosphate isomerase/epimerase
MRIGYNTNGLAHHSFPAAVELLAGLGYESVAITLDHSCLNPFGRDFDCQLAMAAQLLAEHQLHSVIETGARFLLDPYRKHEPTLVSSRAQGRPRRVEFLRHAIDAAALLNSDCVSLWSGVLTPGDSREQGLQRLVEGLQAVLDYAARREVRIAFEPEPGMLIDTMDCFADLLTRIDAPHLGLTLDIGHLHCLREAPAAQVIGQWSNRLWNVHLEDMRAGIHEHLMFGEGEIDFPPIIQALSQSGYQGGLHVELSRHSHMGPIAARQAHQFLSPLVVHQQSLQSYD